MTPAAILATVEAQGAKLHLVDGDKIAVTPKGALDDSLRAEIKREKPALLALLKTEPPVAASDYFGSRFADLFVTLTKDIGTADDLEAIAWAERHGWPGITKTLRDYDRRCEQLAGRDDEPAFRHAVEQLVALFQAIRSAYEAATAPDAPEPVATITPRWRLAIMSTRLRPPPIRLDAARSVVGDVAGHVEILLGKLAVAVAHKNAGRRGSFYAASVDEWLGELKLCGVAASLEVVQ